MRHLLLGVALKIIAAPASILFAATRKDGVFGLGTASLQDNSDL